MAYPEDELQGGLLGRFNLENPYVLGGLMMLGARRGETPQILQSIAQMSEQQKRRAMQERAEAEQRQIRQLELTRARGLLDRDNRVNALAPQFMRPGAAPSLTPNDDEGNPMPSTAPSFDFPGYANALTGIDPRQGLALQAQLAQMNQKQQPKYHVVGGALVPEPTQPGQSAQPVYRAPQDQWQTLGRDPQTGQMIQENSRTGERRAVGMKPSQTSVNLPPAQRAFEVETAKLDAKQLGEWRESAVKAQGGLSRIQEMKRLAQEGTYSGWGASGRASVVNFFDTLGLPFDRTKLENSQQYTKHAKELTLTMLKEGVGASQISNADLAFVNETVPQLETNPRARLALLDYIERRLGSSVDRFQRGDAHARERGGLGGFNFQTQEPQRPTGPLKKNQTALYQARQAIKAGKSREAVIQRLREQGFDPAGL